MSLRRLSPFALAMGLWIALLPATTRADDITIEGLARSAGIFTALSFQCSVSLKIDLAKAKKYAEAFTVAGKEAFGEERFVAALRQQNDLIAKEIRTVGARQWCSDEREFVNRAGAGDVFAESTVSADQMATILADLVVAGSACGFKPSGAPLAPLILRYGFKLEDFAPGGKFDSMMSAKMISTRASLGSHQQSCESMIDFIKQFLPEVVNQ